MQSKIIQWATAIQLQEGYYKTSRSYRNNNPGNLRWANQRMANGKDKDGFAIFFTYQDGFNALCNQLKAACDGRSKVYNPDQTLYQFFFTYAPDTDNNNSRAYAEKVAAILNVDPTIKIKELL